MAKTPYIHRQKETENILSKIQNSQQLNSRSSTIICIDGCGGAGKSTYATYLSKNLGDCPVIHTDDFASWDNPLNWYERMLEQVLRPLAKDQLAKYQKYDWGTKKLGAWLEVRPQKFIIIEGVSSCRKEFRPYISFGIFIKTPRELRLKRGLERDGSAARNQWLEWMKEEDTYVAEHEPQLYAGAVISGDN